MGGVVDAVFGKEPDKISHGDLINKFSKARREVFGGFPEGGASTGFSTFNPNTGLFSVDPTGRNLQLGGLDTFRKSLGDTREQFLGNRQAFEDATVRPLLRRIEAERGRLSRELGRTGVRGTFADRGKSSFDIAAGQAETDERAKATDRFLKAITALDTAAFEAEAGTGARIFEQELRALGLSTEAINNLLQFATSLTTGTAAPAVSSQASADQLAQDRLTNIRGFVGGLFS